MMAWGDKWSATAEHPPMQPRDSNGDPVELRIVNATTGRQVPRDKVRLRPTNDSETSSQPNSRQV
jgi:hypothetical protein